MIPIIQQSIEDSGKSVTLNTDFYHNKVFQSLVKTEVKSYCKDVMSGNQKQKNQLLLFIIHIFIHQFLWKCIKVSSYVRVQVNLIYPAHRSPVLLTVSFTLQLGHSGSLGSLFDFVLISVFKYTLYLNIMIMRQQLHISSCILRLKYILCIHYSHVVTVLIRPSVSNNLKKSK